MCTGAWFDHRVVGRGATRAQFLNPSHDWVEKIICFRGQSTTRTEREAARDVALTSPLFYRDRRVDPTPWSEYFTQQCAFKEKLARALGRLLRVVSFLLVIITLIVVA